LKQHSSEAGRFLGGAVAALGVWAVALAGCGNPVVDSRITALGDEDPNVAPSEYHRAGQPCVLCHSEYEGASPEMSVGGTIFATVDDQIPVGQVTVQLTDALGESRTLGTNCVGSFYLTKDEWNPAFPLQASITYTLPLAGMEAPTTRVKTMTSRISRDGSCASCHSGKRTQASTGWIYCEDKQPPTPFAALPGCPGTVPPPVAPPAP
jgi:hypothetical protein